MTGIVRTKIAPPRRRVGLLHRPRLVDFLHNHINRKLLLVSAAPGYGKTSLLTDFLQDTDLPTCWYAMDSSDRDPWTFMAHLVSTVSGTFPQLAEGSLASLAEAPSLELNPQSLLQALVNNIQEKIADYFVILIDDFQFMDEAESILDLVTWFLDHQPDNCCLILASRTTPELPYLQLTARQEIAGLGSEDLAFTAEEIQAYLELNHNLKVSMEEAETLAVESEGWITGILLGTHTLYDGLIRSMTAAKGSTEGVFEYMAQEIFDRQPEGTQQFLKATSILKLMLPDFCDALLKIDDSDQLLEKLENANLFVTRLTGDEKAYRYHALFQEFLLKQYEPDGLPEKQALHQGAGRLLEAGEQGEAALEHFLLAGTDPEAVRVLLSLMEPTYRAGRLVTLIRWLEALDPEALAAEPLLLLMRGRLHRQEGEFDQALERYRQARDLYVDQGDRTGELEVRIHEALVHRYKGDIREAKEIAEEALSQPGELSDTAKARAHRILGEAHHLSGQLSESKREFRQSLKLYEKAGDLYHAATLLHALGTTARRMGNPLEAEGHYTRALAILEKLGNRWRIADIKNNIGVGHYYQGEYEKAHEILQAALAESREVGHARTEALVLQSLGDLYTDTGEVRQAQRVYQDSLEGARENKDLFLEVINLCAMASLYRLDQAWEQAHTLLSEAEALTEVEDSGYMRGLVAMAQGLVFHNQDQLEEAATALEKSIRTLEAAGAQRELTKAHLWNANTHFRLGKQAESLEGLRKAMELAQETKHPHMLVVEGSKMQPLLESAKDLEGMEQLLVRVREFTLVAAREVGREVAPEVQLEIRTLGEATIRVDGQVIPHTAWGGPLVKELFFFVLEREPVRREIILDAFWPEYSTAKAQSVFHASLYRMRRTLPKGIIGYDAAQQAYGLDYSQEPWYDVRAFEDLLSGPSEADRERTLEKALDLYRGEYLPEVYADWCFERRQELHRAHVEALAELAALKAKDSNQDEAIGLLRQAVEAEPYREAFHRNLMHALSEADRPAEALQHYIALKDRLYTEMDLRPTRETTEIYEAIRKKVNS